MNELSSLELILLFALFAGHVVKFSRLPEVTGYILAGVAYRRFAEYGGAVSTVVLAAVVVYKMIGRVSVRFAITRSGEAQPRVPEPVESLCS